MGKNPHYYQIIFRSYINNKFIIEFSIENLLYFPFLFSKLLHQNKLIQVEHKICCPKRLKNYQICTYT